MKQYNEGYVLPLVLVVLVVLCTVSLSVMAPAVSNLKVQEASIERMQDRYEVLGHAKSDLNELRNVLNLALENDLPTTVWKETEQVFNETAMIGMLAEILCNGDGDTIESDQAKMDGVDDSCIYSGFHPGALTFSLSNITEDDLLLSYSGAYNSILSELNLYKTKINLTVELTIPFTYTQTSNDGKTRHSIQLNTDSASITQWHTSYDIDAIGG